MLFEVREFKEEDYDAALALWKRCEGMGLSSADERGAISRFLKQNPTTCFVALAGNALVATILGGNDGRRGYLYHLAVDPSMRKQGIGKMLVERFLEAMKEIGIQKCHLMVFSSNKNGQDFWEHEGWQYRSDIVLMSKDVTCSKESGLC
jgi:ribosomal protein S18 acetylase RimI-like enzyme